MQIAQYNENEQAQKSKVTSKIDHRARLKLVEANEEETNPLINSPTAKPTKPAKENPIVAKIEESNNASIISSIYPTWGKNYWWVTDNASFQETEEALCSLSAGKIGL